MIEQKMYCTNCNCDKFTLAKCWHDKGGDKKESFWGVVLACSNCDEHYLAEEPNETIIDFGMTRMCYNEPKSEYCRGCGLHYVYDEYKEEE
jgi:hypothetical protein